MDGSFVKALRPKGYSLRQMQGLWESMDDSERSLVSAGELDEALTALSERTKASVEEPEMMER